MATVEVIDNNYEREIKGAKSINGYAMLIDEQRLLDKAKNDADCLNNNAEAYVPNWITVAHKEKFEKFIADRKSKANK